MRELWLKFWDKNTKIFHLSTIIQRRHNNIDAIKDENGTWITSSNHIRQHLLQSFKSQFEEEEVSFPEHLGDLVQRCIFEAENLILRSIPTLEEIKATLFHMQGLKGP